MKKKNKWKIKRVGIKRIPIKWIILIIIITGGVITTRDVAKKLYTEKTMASISLGECNNIKMNHTTLIKKEIEITKISNIKRISAYNVGIVAQNDSTPCFGARGHNLCEMLEQGINVCACNSLPLHTEIEIEGYGKCIILDRMNSRYQNGEVDIAMSEYEYDRAMEWGVKYREVKIIN